MKNFKFLCIPILLILPFQLLAQNEVERERLSLQGLQEFGFTATVEGSRTIAGDPNLTPGMLRQDAVNQLREAEIRYVTDEEVSSSADIPFLFMHVNAMELENGLVPFSIELRLYQPVKLVLNRDLQTSASTWENSVVGIVTLDRLPMINEAASSLVADFLEDYAVHNRR
tara:strand:- start:2622 stop:3131 length:510 start_codon:yes stop_codon:yes gene_type:complete